jgi:hypothetical protein
MVSLPGFGRVLGPTIAISGSNRRHTGSLCGLYVSQVITNIQATLNVIASLLRSMQQWKRVGLRVRGCITTH